MKICGVYCIRNLINGKIYIGSSQDVDKRWKEHKRLLKRNLHDNQYLQNAWNKYGEQNFQFEIKEKIEVNDNLKKEEIKNILLEREQITIDETLCCKRDVGYNMCIIARSPLGRVMREESIILMKKSAKKGEDARSSKLKWYQVNEMREKYLSGGYTHEQLAKEYKVNETIIGDVIYGRTWKDENYQVDVSKIDSIIRNNYRDAKTGEKNRMFGRYMGGEKCLNSKLKWYQVNEIREKYLSGDYTQRQLGDKYGVDNSIIGDIVYGRTWKDENYQVDIKKIKEIKKNNQIKNTPKGQNHPFYGKMLFAKLKWCQVDEIRKKYSNGNYTQKQLSNEYSVSSGRISEIVNNKVWKRDKNNGY